MIADAQRNVDRAQEIELVALVHVWRKCLDATTVCLDAHRWDPAAPFLRVFVEPHRRKIAGHECRLDVKSSCRLPGERCVGRGPVPDIVPDLDVSPSDGSVAAQNERLVDKVGGVTMLNPNAGVSGPVHAARVWRGRHRPGRASRHVVGLDFEVRQEPTLLLRGADRIQLPTKTARLVRAGGTACSRRERR